MKARREADRVAAVCERAHLVIKLGNAALGRLENSPDCRTVCRYPDGGARFTRPDGSLSHRCGR